MIKSSSYDLIWTSLSSILHSFYARFQLLLFCSHLCRFWSHFSAVLNPFLDWVLAMHVRFLVNFQQFLLIFSVSWKVDFLSLEFFIWSEEENTETSFVKHSPGSLRHMKLFYCQLQSIPLSKGGIQKPYGHQGV